MLQNIRKNLQGTIAKVIVAIIIVPFALFGIESLVGGGGVQNVAQVNGEAISAIDLQQQINLQKRRLMMSMGENVDPSLLDDQLLAGPALEYMVQKALLLQSAAEHGLAVSDERLNALITSNEAFQVDGQFNPQRYQVLLSDQGFTPAGFRKAMREDVMSSQLRAGISGAEFTTAQELAQMATLREERRDIRYLSVPIGQFKDASSVSDEDIANWYEDNSARYQTTENIDLDYIALRVEDFAVEISEAEVRELFELQKDTLQVPELRAVSHILFEPADGESDEALQARVDAVRQQVEVDGANFAALAYEHSQDLGSANFGGELGFTSGDTFPPKIEDAIAKLNLNQVSEPVESESGWHLLLVTEIRSGAAPTFDEMRTELESQLQGERSQRELVKTSERLKDLVFNAEDLSGPAEELGLSVARVDAVNRYGGRGMFADNRVIAAAFSPELLEEGYNSEVLELEEGLFLVVRVAQHYPAALKPLAQVRSDVIDAILDSQARDNASQHADGLLVRLSEGASIEELALAGNYEWQVELGARRDNRNVPRATLARAFEIATNANGSVFDYVQTPEGDVEVFEIFRVTAGSVDKIDERRKTQIGLGLADQSARALDNAFQQTLVKRAEVVRS